MEIKFILIENNINTFYSENIYPNDNTLDWGGTL